MSLSRPKLLPPTPPADLVSADVDGDELQLHPGYGLTARGLVAAYREAELGYVRWQCDLFDDVIESSGHLRSQLEGRLKAVAGKPWIVQPGGDTPADQQAAAELEQALRDVPNFRETLGHQCKANWYGWSASEIQWERVGGTIVPTWFANVPHRRIEFDESGNPFIKVAERNDIEVLQPLAPGSWWTSVAGGHWLPARAGLMRTASWWELFKRLAVRDWIVFAERFGLPYVTGEYAPGASPRDKATLKAAIAALGRDGQAMFSNTCKIVVHTVHDGGKSSDVHGAITGLCNAEISKLVTGATLTSETAGPGSFALGKVHADSAFVLRASDAEDLGARFESDIGGPFVRWNRMDARPPRLRINVTPDLDPLTRAEIASILANDIGLKLDEGQMRQEQNMRKPVGEPLVGAKGGKVNTGAPIGD